jgi:hypothetical protein
MKKGHCFYMNYETVYTNMTKKLIDLLQKEYP